MADTIWLLIYIVLLLLLSGFFSGTEIAYLSADRLRLKLDSKRGGIIGRTLSMLYRRPDRFITTLLVGNNIVLVIYGMVMTRLLYWLLSVAMQSFRSRSIRLFPPLSSLSSGSICLRRVIV